MKVSSGEANTQSGCDPQPGVKRCGERGSMMIMVGFALIALFAAASLAVDMGYVYMSRQQLQIAADAAALAGVRELAADDQQAARAMAAATAQSNEVAGRPVVLDPESDVVFGRWENQQFIPGHPDANALRVTIQRTSNSSQGPIDMFLGPVVGVDSVDIAVSAVAKLAAIDMALVLDTSSSMTDDTYYSRCTRRMGFRCGCGTAPSGYEPIDTLKTSASSFVGDFDENIDQIAAIEYANQGNLLQGLTASFSLVTDEIVNIPAPNYCSGARYTNIGDGINRGIQELTGPRARLGAAKILVLLSDGQPTCSRTGHCTSSASDIASGKAYAREMAAQAAQQRITIQCISLGDAADRQLMQEVASVTGGNEFFAQTGDELDRVFADVRKRRPVQLTN